MREKGKNSLSGGIVTGGGDKRSLQQVNRNEQGIKEGVKGKTQGSYQRKGTRNLLKSGELERGYKDTVLRKKRAGGSRELLNASSQKKEENREIRTKDEKTSTKNEEKKKIVNRTYCSERYQVHHVF